MRRFSEPPLDAVGPRAVDARRANARVIAGALTAFAPGLCVASGTPTSAEMTVLLATAGAVLLTAIGVVFWLIRTSTRRGTSLAAGVGWVVAVLAGYLAYQLARG